ncbi:hypothetical protein NDU88_007843 [Pleurodeles waltl]|uniref:Uncharacterized protein n=1 Tax=Pleurodeles waltl TaxID=8319 RepID=A0AAV7STH0_PLEWA|nr:hypothetical protein NDU88_007843 [Pleurodeles waltl]
MLFGKRVRFADAVAESAQAAVLSLLPPLCPSFCRGGRAPEGLCSYYLQTLTDPKSVPDNNQEEERAWKCLHRFLLRKQALNA